MHPTGHQPGSEWIAQYATPPKPNTDKVAQLGWEHGLPPQFQPQPTQLPPGMANWPTPQHPISASAFPPMTVPPIQPPSMPIAETQPRPPTAPLPPGEVVYSVIRIARQDRGEFVFVATEGVFADKDKAFAFASSRGEKNWWEKIMGSDCWCERGVHETVLYSN